MPDRDITARPLPSRKPCLTAVLRMAGLRPTRQRVALAELLFGGPHRHVSAEQLHGEASMANVNVSLATIYNTLHQFHEAGLLREVAIDASRSSSSAESPGVPRAAPRTSLRSSMSGGRFGLPTMGTSLATSPA